MDTYVGIDYGMGKSNIDPKTGIRFGVISQNEVLQSWADSSEPNMGNPHCPHCGEELEESDDNETCPHCGKEIESEDLYGDEAVSFYLKDNEYTAETDSIGDIFIFKSIYYTLCQYCSPCAPGAGYIMHPVENGVKAYCFGHDWFDDGKAPYPVYSVETDELVNPNKEPSKPE